MARSNERHVILSFFDGIDVLTSSAVVLPEWEPGGAFSALVLPTVKMPSDRIADLDE